MDSNENTGKISGRGGATLIAAQNGDKIFLIAGFAGDSVYTRFCTTLNCHFHIKRKTCLCNLDKQIILNLYCKIWYSVKEQNKMKFSFLI